MKDLLISVVIPMYNRSKTIIECLDSICNQTYKNIEIIVVDDCSNDNSVDLVENYNDSRVKVIKLLNNSGAQVARNKGIIESKGNWIAFNDSDDLWHPSKLELQLEELKKVNYNEYTVIHSNCICLDLINNKSWEWKLPLTEGSCYINLLKTSSPMFQAILTSKKALLEIGLLDENVPSYQEWDTSIRLSKICNFIHIVQPLFTYVFHNGETISKNTLRDFVGYEYIFNKYFIEIKDSGLYKYHLIILYLKSLYYKQYALSDKYIEMMNINILKKYFLLLIYKFKIRPFRGLGFVLRRIIK